MTLPISVTLSAPQGYPSTNVRINFKNESPNKCYEITRHSLMENNIPGDNFQITNQKTNEEAVYTGPTIKRQQSYTPIRPGEVKTVDVQLSQLYQIPKGINGVTYVTSVEYRACDNHVVEDTLYIESNSISIEV